jgi:hypothetical protein
VQQITIAGSPVGIAGLEKIFLNWQASGTKAQDLTNDQVLQAIRKHNYVIPRLEDEYAEAIRAHYAACSEKSVQK